MGKFDNKKIKDSDLYLIYILKVGENYKEEGIYEFIFSDNKDQLPHDYEDWGWSETPAKDIAQPPSRDFIKRVLTLKTNKIKLEVLHDSQYFSYLDGFDCVIALAWEKFDEESEDESDDDYSDVVKRLVFHYGDTIKDVEEKLYSRELVLQID
jgi:hypothetical protein